MFIKMKCGTRRTFKPRAIADTVKRSLPKCVKL
jgi:hypothetical protein